MLFLLTLFLASFCSIQSEDLPYTDNFFYNYCKVAETDVVGPHFCEPFFVYFKSFLIPFPTTNACKACDTIVKDLKKEGHVEKVVQSFLQTISTRFCDSLDLTLRENCKVWIRGYSKNIQSLIVTQIEDEELCHHLLNCKKETLDLMTGRIGKWFPLCDVCIKEVSSIEKNYLNGVSLHQLTDTINQFICKNAPVRFYDDCSSLSKSVADKLLKIIRRFHDSRQFCTDINFCSLTPSIVPVPSFFDYFFQFEKITTTNICDACYNVTTEQFETLAKSVTLDKWRTLGYTFLCNDPIEEPFCKSFVDAITEPLVTQIRQLMTRENMCHGILHCPINRNEDNIYYEYPFFVKEFENKPRDSCFFCKVISNLLVNLLKDPRQIEATEVYLKQLICRNKRSNLQQCLQTVGLEVSIIMQYMTQQLKQGSLCKPMCAASSNFAISHMHKPLEPYSCTMIINVLKRSIGSDTKNEKWVELQIKNVCNDIFLREHPQCYSLIKGHETEIKEMIMTDLDSNAICKKINKNFELVPNQEFFPYSFFYDFFAKKESHPYQFIGQPESYSFDFFRKEETHPFTYFFKFFHYFMSNESYPYHFFDKEKSPPVDVSNKEIGYYPRYFDYFAFYPFKFFDASYPISHPKKIPNVNESFLYKFFEKYMKYPYMYFTMFDKEESFPFSFYFKKEGSYPFEFFSKYFYKFFNKKEYYPYYYFNKNEKKPVVDCDECKTYIQELKSLQKLYQSNPKFWEVSINDLCASTGIDVYKCRSEIEKFFEKLFKIIESGNAVKEICKNSCKTVEVMMDICIREPETYCRGNLIAQCGTHGKMFCQLFFK